MMIRIVLSATTFTCLLNGAISPERSQPYEGGASHAYPHFDAEATEADTDKVSS